MKNKGVTLIELIFASFVVGIASLSFMWLTTTSQKGHTTSLQSLHAQLSADELLVRISRTKWDRNKPDGAQMDLIGPPRLAIDPRHRLVTWQREGAGSEPMATGLRPPPGNRLLRRREPRLDQD